MKDLIKGAALFIGGAMVGAAAALLLTPKTGEEVRQQIADVAEDAKQKVKEYCEQHNITKDSYYYWLRTVREATLHSMGPVFAELSGVLPFKLLKSGNR